MTFFFLEKKRGCRSPIHKVDMIFNCRSSLRCAESSHQLKDTWILLSVITLQCQKDLHLQVTANTMGFNSEFQSEMPLFKDQLFRDAFGALQLLLKSVGTYGKHCWNTGPGLSYWSFQNWRYLEVTGHFKKGKLEMTVLLKAQQYLSMTNTIDVLTLFSNFLEGLWSGNSVH